MKVAQSDRGNLLNQARAHGCFFVVLGELTFVDWLLQIEFEVTNWLKTTGSNVRVMRLYRTLRFTLAGRVFASLSVDEDGLLFRQWDSDVDHQDYPRLHVNFARRLVKLSITAAETRTLTE